MSLGKRGNFRLGNYDTSFLLALTHTKASLLVIFHFPGEMALASKASKEERDLIQFSKESSASMHDAFPI